MKYCSKLTVLFCLTWINGEAAPVNNEAKLREQLFKNYNSQVYPILGSPKAIIVEYIPELISIIDMDEKNQFIKVYLWTYMMWKNELLTWDPLQYENISAIYVEKRMIWVPSIDLYNRVNHELGSSGGDSVLVRIRHDGGCTLASYGTYTTLCHMDVSKFPFDVQTCTLKFGPWHEDTSTIDLSSNHTFKVHSHYVENEEWAIAEGIFKRNVIVYTSGTYVDVTLSLKLKRTITGYLIRFIVPCVLISLLMILVFLLPAHTGERMGLAVTLLLAVAVFQQLTGEFLPAFGIPLISRLYLFTMCQMVLLLSFSTIVIVLDCGIDDNASNWLQWFVVSVLRSKISDGGLNSAHKGEIESSHFSDNNGRNNNYHNECSDISDSPRDVRCRVSTNNINLHEIDPDASSGPIATAESSTQKSTRCLSSKGSAADLVDKRDRPNWKKAAARCNLISIMVYVVSSIFGAIYVVYQAYC